MSAALSNLRRSINSLLDSTSDTNTSLLADSKGLAIDVRTTLLTELAPGDTALALSLLFNAERGVIQFLKITRGSKAHDDAKAVLLETVADYAAKHPREIREFAVEIKVRASRPFLVKSSILELLGFLSRHYSQCADDKQRLQLQRFYMQTLESLFNVRGKEPDAPLIAGAIRGLDHYMFTIEGDNKIVAKDMALIFKALKHVIQPAEDLTRYALPIAGLQMIIDHAKLLQPLLYSDYRTVYSYLREMSSHKNRDLHKVGFAAVDAFLKQIAAILLEEQEGKAELNCFWYFMKNFSDSLRNTDSSVRDISLAIRGYGLFAGPCKKFLNATEVHQIMNILLTRSTFLFSEANENQEETAGHIAAFIEAFAYICRQLDVQDDAFMSGIEQIVGAMLVNFTKIGRALRHASVVAFVRLLYALYANGGARFQAFWSKLAFDAIVLTCTDALLEAERTEGEEGDLPDHAYQEYITFWENLFDQSSLASEPDVDKFFIAVYDIIISAILQVPDRLDLKTVDTGGEAAGSDPQGSVVVGVPPSGDVTNLKASNAKDFAIFINFVEFCSGFLTKVRSGDFKRWVRITGERWIDASTRLPLVSGFYKLLATCFEICEREKYFEGLGGGGEAPATAPSLEQSTYILFRKYIKEVVVRMQNYKDDLLASCLRLVLAAPQELLVVSEMVEPLKLALKMGLSYPPLALIALDAMDKITMRFTLEELEEACRDVLPTFMDYLLVEDGGLDL
ncbi:hypothetical protein HK097_008382, partial [Rhizophlyctis rosea]